MESGMIYGSTDGMEPVKSGAMAGERGYNRELSVASARRLNSRLTSQTSSPHAQLAQVLHHRDHVPSILAASQET